MARRSPLSPGAYGKPQRWHEILTEAADARAAEREEKRHRNEKGAAAAFGALIIVSLFS